MYKPFRGVFQKFQKDTSFRTEDMTLLANFCKEIRQQINKQTHKNLHELGTSIKTSKECLKTNFRMTYMQEI